MADVGLMYTGGMGVPQNLDQGRIWLTKAAIKGQSIVQRELGLMYYERNGVPQDYQVSFDYQGRSSTPYDLGTMFFNGHGVGQNLSVAFERFLKAAEQGYSRAQSSVGRMFSAEQGTFQNYIKAFE
ncbi:hypothetical protein BGX24_007820 [Mortierella sp. AD032]|nr:hypothetical protein BGX24_007820 [Mortierella sp. AD032]